MIRTNVDKVFLPGFVKFAVEEILFTHKVIFDTGKDHSEHDSDLIQLIASHYLKIRLRHEASILSEVDHYIRRSLTKLIIFKNQ